MMKDDQDENNISQSFVTICAQSENGKNERQNNQY